MFKIFKKKNDRRKIGWNDISIKQFMEISKVDYEDEADNIYEYLAIINNTTLDDILNMDIHRVVEMIKDLEFLKEAPKKGINPKKEYVINGTKYKVLMDPNQMTTAQYIDFQMINGNYDSHIPDILSIFMVPEGKKYNDGYNLEEAKQEIYENLGVEDAITIAGFFCFWSSVLMRLMVARSTRELRKMERKEKDPEVKQKLKEARMRLKTLTRNVQELS